jgi:hypothetical protein
MSAQGAAAAQAAECKSLSLSASVQTSEPELKELDAALQDYEKAFATEDGSIYHALVHPSKHQSLFQSKAQFETVFPSYGLVRPKLTRAAMFEIKFAADEKSWEVACSLGKARGVVGPQHQFVVQHTAFSKNEQTRITTIFAPIPKGVKSLNKTKYNIGIVMFHTQAWSHEHKTPAGLLEESRKWNRLKSPAVAWIFAEAARRILNSNPYFAPSELGEAAALVNELSPRLPAASQIQKLVGGDVTSWEYLGLTLVYQGYGVEPGFVFRMKPDDELNKDLNKCRKSVAGVARHFKELRDRFHGVECIPYAVGESQETAPKGGTMFVPWRELPIP